MAISKPKLTAALVGAGMVAKTHVEACAAISHKLRLKYIVSRGGDSAKALASDASAMCAEEAVFATSLEVVLADKEIDFVIVATPPDTRLSIINPLVSSGKSILLEKPVGKSFEESRKIVNICADANVLLGVVFQHRTRLASKKALEFIENGFLGELGVVEINVPWWREQSYYDEPGRGTYARDGGGVLISQAIHSIDLALSLTGPVSKVHAMAKSTILHKMESEDFVVAGLEFSNGAFGSLMASTASFPGASESIVLHCENASLRLEAGQLTVTKRDGSIEIYGEEVGTGGGADPMAFTHQWHQSIIENFVDALNGHDQLFASGQQALHAHALIDAIILSAHNKSPEKPRI